MSKVRARDNLLDVIITNPTYNAFYLVLAVCDLSVMDACCCRRDCLVHLPEIAVQLLTDFM